MHRAPGPGLCAFQPLRQVLLPSPFEQWGKCQVAGGGRGSASELTLSPTQGLCCRQRGTREPFLTPSRPRADNTLWAREAPQREVAGSPRVERRVGGGPGEDSRRAQGPSRPQEAQSRCQVYLRKPRGPWRHAGGAGSLPTDQKRNPPTVGKSAQGLLKRVLPQ